MRFFLRLTLLLTTLLNASWALAVDISVNFTATIKETTCAMTVSGLNGASLTGDTGANSYFLDLPDMGVSDVVNKTSLTEASFKIKPSNCNNYISTLSMTLSGKVSSYTNTLIGNDQSISGHTNYAGLAIKRMNTDESLRFKLDGSQNVNWTQDEIINGLDLTAFIRQTSSSNKITPGSFQAKATIIFTYQ
ncbi:fimbrial protein [Escherichia coli]|nr:fimbrial protein [Escherichia coli]VTQ30559.1 putative fimbrial protein StaD [Streptococcus pneumoniae]